MKAKIKITEEMLDAAEGAIRRHVEGLGYRVPSKEWNPDGREHFRDAIRLALHAAAEVAAGKKP